ncbi:energy-coupling factor transporter transmembrane protein EcfT [bacterium]|nr:energy-coupling factor transporter transmembrane protein EcfT [bacterium]
MVLICALSYIICVLLSQTWQSLCSLTLVGFFGLMLVKVRLAKVLSDIGKAWLLLVSTFTIHWFISSHYLGLNEGKFIYFLNYEQGLIALRFSARFALILGVVSCLSRLHDLQRYGRSIGRILSKSPIGKHFLSKVELTATLALRMVPFIQNQYYRLNLALEARGEKFSSNSIGSMRRLNRLLFPLMVQSIRRADRTAIALQARGYDPVIVRSSYRQSISAFSSWLIAFGFVSFSVLPILI